MSTAKVATAAAVGYLVGTLPSASTAARLASKGAIDIRATGTGNPGAINAIAVLGKKWGLAVMAADIAKGALAATAGRAISGPNGAHLAATAAVVGHCHPPWGRGGKGVATGVGQCAATFPVALPFNLAVAATTVVPRLRSRARAATLVGSLAWVAAALVWWRRKLPNGWGPPPTKALPVAAAASSAVILNRFYGSS